jgi:small subunit ribosomal protein S19
MAKSNKVIKEDKKAVEKESKIQVTRKKFPCFSNSLRIKIQKYKQGTVKQPIKIWQRYMMIIPECVGVAFEIYNGCKFKKLIVNENHIGFKFGDFSLTRVLPKHSPSANKK